MAATITPAPCTTHPSHYQAGCTHCRARSNWYNKRLRAHRRAGRWQPMIDIIEVRAHIATLRTAGMVLTDIAQAAGISDGYLNAIVYDPNRRKVNPTVGGILLSLTPRPSQPFLIDPTGTRRRLQALQAAGWTRQAIAEHLGVHESLPGKWVESPTVTRTTAARVKQAYDQLGDLPGPSPIAAKRAAARGWVDSYHWPDNSIDDPNAKPWYGTDAAAVDVANLRDTVAELTFAGLSAKDIGDRLDLDPRSVTRHRAAIRQAAANQAAA